MAVSLVTQSVIVGSVLVASLMQTGHLAWRPSIVVYAPPLAAAPSPPPQAVRSAAVQAVLRPVFRPALIAPRKMPLTAAHMGEPDPAPWMPTGTGAAGPAGIESLAIQVEPAKPVPSPPASRRREPEPKPSVVKIGGDVQAAKLIRQVRPAYPAMARAARISGVVRLQALIGRDGHIRNLQLLSGPPLLVAASLDAVRQWIYAPTLLNGEPVEVMTQIDVNFTLN